MAHPFAVARLLGRQAMMYRPEDRLSRRWDKLGGVVLLSGLLACAGGPEGSSAVPSEGALRDTLKHLIEGAYDFGQAGVLERMGALYPDAGRVVSASGGKIIASADSLRAGLRTFWETAGQYMQDARWEWGEVLVDRLGQDAAVLTATWRIPHVAPTGRPHVIQGAWTAVFRRINGEWKIVVEHLSTPPGG
ncbi:MAG: YybH family protein [Gemmatimonadales bacterium]